MVPFDLTDTIRNPVCPTNGKLGTPVSILTLKAMLDLPLTELRETAYRLCNDPDCPTVYYSEDGFQIFEETGLRERVYQKHPVQGEVFVCYCFRYTVGEVTRDIKEHATPTIPAAITAGVQAGKCACDIRNPQGRCCLGNVSSLVKRIKSENRIP